jgi:FdhD protein
MTAETVLDHPVRPGQRASDTARVPPPVTRVRKSRWRGQVVTAGDRALPEEIPVALTYNGSSHAVMMASPADLEDFAIGFSLTEGVIRAMREIETLEVIPGELGIELRMFLSHPQAERLQGRRRAKAGATGCGLCGIESIAEAMPALPAVDTPLRIAADSIRPAVEDFASHQHLNRQAHALHAAAF